MFISTVAIKRPVFTAMIICAMLVFGVVSLKGLGIDLFPKIDFPVVTVLTTLRGADPETVESRVTDVIEESVNTLAGIKKLRSTSAEGVSQIVVEFQLEKNVDVAFQEVQARVNTVRALLPTDVDDPVIEKFDVDAAPIMTLVVSGDLGARELYDLADKRIKEQLQRVNDVGSVKIVGGQERKLWLWLDPIRLRQHNLTVQDVRSALLRQHIEIPGGRIETDKLELVTRTKAEFASATDLDELVLVEQEGMTVRLKDVGRAEDGLEEFRSYAQRDDKPGIALQIRRQSGTNTVQVAHDVKAEIERMRPPLASEGVRLDIAVDMSLFIQRSVDEVEHHLMVGGALAVFTVMIFLLNFRSTFISAMVLPTSIMATFMMMAYMGFTLNFMTLMALTLAIGLLIDDAIVVQENIMRHVQSGKPAAWAAEFATKEIGLAVLATTLSVVAVFLPTAYTKGIVGRFFFPFGMTISFAVLISMMVSFTLDPMLSSRLLRKQVHVNPVFRTLERMFQATERMYERVLGWCLGHRWLVVGMAVAFFVASISLGQFIRTEFVPQEDQGEFEILARAPLGSPLVRTRAIFEQMRDRLKDVPEIVYTFYSIGGDQMGKVNEGNMYVRLRPKAERLKAGMRLQQQMMAYARERLNDLPEAIISVQQVNAIGGGTFKATQIQYEIAGPNLDVLAQTSEQLLDRMKQAGGYKDLDSSHQAGRPETSILIQRDRAADLGVSPMDVADTVREAIGGMDVAKFRTGKDRYDIAVRFLESARNDPQRILELTVPSIKGQPVEMRSIAQVMPSFVPVEINRANRQRQITVLANLEASKALGTGVQEIDGFIREIGIPGGYSTAWAGDAEHMQESFGNLMFTMMLSVIVTYMILAAQFESLVHPFTIMLSLPLAFVGAIGAILLLGQTMSIFVMMAFIFLLGLVTKNAILLIDYTNTLRERDGLPRDEALQRAGPVRLRPILMTTVAMIFGMLPSAVGVGEGSESRQPMAVAIVGGLVSSTMLTLLIVPVVYSLLDPLSEWMRRRVLELKGLPAQRTSAGAGEDDREVVGTSGRN
jgi:hydrophobic/amphiphilic exporter-1 (mainly G- bacteria), HAE1 family